METSLLYRKLEIANQITSARNHTRTKNRSTTMGNAQSIDGGRCGSMEQCGPAGIMIPVVKAQQKNNLVASPRSAAEELAAVEAKQQQQQQQGNNNNEESTNATSSNEESTSTEEDHNKDNNNNNIVATTPTSTTKSRGRYVLSAIKTTIKSTIKDIFDPPEPERLPPKRHKPKHMLHGCTTVDEHYDYIEEMCQKVADLKGREGMEAFGFYFRIVHHPENCTCVGVVMQNDDLTDSEADPEEMKEGYMEDEEDDDDDDDYAQFVDESFDNSLEGSKPNSYLVPIGAPLKIPEEGSPVRIPEEQKLETMLTPLQNNSSSNYSTPYSVASAASSSNFPTPFSTSSTGFSRKDSAVSLFSLATHNTDFSCRTSNTRSTDGDGSRRRHRKARFPLSSISSSAAAVMEQDSCALRLHHTETGTLLTPENHQRFVADGNFYDELARCCMEYAQEVMMEESNLEFVTIEENETDPEKSFGAIATKSFLERRRASTTKRKTLLVVTGKGQVGAGIFSRRHLLVTSMEAATSLPFLREAKERDMDVVMLDPNALGYRNGMDVVEKSLEYFFLAEGNAVDDKEEIYLLAHSMAGAQVVRFFIDSSSCHNNNSRPATPSSCASSLSDSTNNADGDDDNTPDKTALRLHLLQRIKAFALTDSNHNINWIKNHPVLMDALTGPPSLYIKSHKVHEKAKELGQSHDDCQFWRHRFGDIKTLWAGTHEHALTNYTARAHIWEHFDRFLYEPPGLAAARAEATAERAALAEAAAAQQQQQQQLPPRSPVVAAKS